MSTLFSTANTTTTASRSSFLYSPPLHFSYNSPQFLPLKPKSKSKASFTLRASLSDPFVLDIAEKLEDSVDSTSTSVPSLQRLREVSTQSLLTKPWPTSKQEAFRFTDTSFLRKSQIVPSPLPSSTFDLGPSSSSNSVVIVDGHFAPSFSNVSSLPDSVFAGSISDMRPGPMFNRVSELLSTGGGVKDDKDVFWDLNGVGAPDVVVVYVPEGVRLLEDPIYLRFLAYQGAEVGEETLPVSNPRVLVVVEKGAEVAIVEEHMGIGESEQKCYWENAVVEIVVGEGAKVSHSYVQRQSRNAAHFKWTFARQATKHIETAMLHTHTLDCVFSCIARDAFRYIYTGNGLMPEPSQLTECSISIDSFKDKLRSESFSTYELVEISMGARLSRHNLHIEQLGPDTVTDLSAFHMSQSDQTQDLHSKLVFDHPRAYSRQIHKCIVANSSGQAVFDGNIKVNRFAQQTDAGQLTRTLLLAPRATANVKPNLQIVADDVKCSHGATISDLEEDQIFYFRARGIDMGTARDALVFSFGAEVVEKLPYDPLRKETTNYIKSLLTARSSS